MKLRECLIMACHYHPERESTDTCAICGKPICKECGLEIAGKIYCKDCLQKIVGIGLDKNNEPTEKQPVKEAPVEKPVIEEQPVENIYDTKEEVIYASEEPAPQETQKVGDDSPYNIKDNIEYAGGLESSYLSETEVPQQNAPKEVQYFADEPQPSPKEVEYFAEQPVTQNATEEEFIYPDHSYEPETTSARRDLEDKYEKYLDDLYFDEKEVPLNEQLAKDEEQFGSLTRREYKPSEAPAKDQKRARSETPEEMEARIRAEILKEQGIEPVEKESKKGILGRCGKQSNENIHNLNYQDEKEPMGVVDILLTVVLVIVILIVVYYLIYLFVLHSTYPTFMDALFGLTNPQNVINNILSGTPK